MDRFGRQRTHIDLVVCIEIDTTLDYKYNFLSFPCRKSAVLNCFWIPTIINVPLIGLRQLVQDLMLGLVSVKA